MTKALNIAVLQTGRTIPEALEEHGDYDEMCKAVVGRGPDEADTFAVLDGEFPPSLAPYDVIVITGSKHGVYEGHPWIAPLEELIREAMGEGKKLIGICFGHQIMAQALGGRVEKSDKGLGVGLLTYRVTDAAGDEQIYNLHAWHQDQVVEVPPGAEIIARSDFCAIAGLRYGDQAISLQPHPEFSANYMRALIVARVDSALSREMAEVALDSLQGVCHSPTIAAMFQDFMKAPMLAKA